ncbi:hypothetical protein BKM03_14335 [Pseudomonas avellanae]|uniref:Uncharacterized protein n=1 Tax=Pseudomonas avellanae TaxID=46257 RepID=A0AAD0E130_9PSED|nr:hypothetical protein BKM03_14335 [Pseudomonas avellanae]POP85266.1 hypothetical protein CXB34_17775 [Pseudomonas amygdali pv. morsprunorum]
MFITLRGSRTMDRQDCEHFGLSHDKEKRGEYANTFNAGAKIRTVSGHASRPRNGNLCNHPCASLIRPVNSRPWRSSRIQTTDGV